MSDAAITSIVGAILTIATMLFGFLTMWLKLKYGVEQAEKAAVKAAEVEGKIDRNTEITTKIEKQTNGVLDEKHSAIIDKVSDHALRITALETKVEAIKVGMEAVAKNLDSTRHEIRGHLGTIVTKLDILSHPAIARVIKDDGK